MKKKNIAEIILLLLQGIDEDKKYIDAPKTKSGSRRVFVVDHENNDVVVPRTLDHVEKKGARYTPATSQQTKTYDTKNDTEEQDSDTVVKKSKPKPKTPKASEEQESQDKLPEGETDDIVKVVLDNDVKQRSFSKQESKDILIRNALMGWGRAIYKKKTQSKPAPGTSGSNFSQIMSLQVVTFLQQNPTVTEKQIAKAFYDLYKEAGISGTLSKSTSGGLIQGMPKNDGLAAKLSQAVRSGVKKFERISKKAESLQKIGALGKDLTYHTVWGDKSGLERQVELLNRAKKVVLSDGTQIDKQDAIRFVKAGGGGDNPSDTAIFIEDQNGNLSMSFCSDKMDTAAIQYNSTVKKKIQDEYARIDTLNMKQQQKVKMKKKHLELVNELNKNEDRFDTATEQVGDLIVQKHNENPQILRDAIKKLMSVPTPALARKVNKAMYEKGKMKSQFAATAKKLGLDVNKLSLEDQILVMLQTPLNGQSRACILLLSGAMGKEMGLMTKLGEIRDKSITLMKQGNQDKNNFTVLHNGKEYPAGDFIQAEFVWGSLHLLLTQGKGYEKGKPESLINSQFQIQMGKYTVTGDILAHCVGVKSFDQFLERFGVDNKDDTKIRNAAGDITGNTLFLYTIDDQGNKVPMSRCVYRSKQGQTGKTSVTMTWQKPMQKCFKDSQHLLDKKLTNQSKLSNKQFEQVVTEILKYSKKIG